MIKCIQVFSVTVHCDSGKRTGPFNFAHDAVLENRESGIWFKNFKVQKSTDMVQSLIRRRIPEGVFSELPQRSIKVVLREASTSACEKFP